jgi:adenine-specific DNA-methyltransferase
MRAKNIFNHSYCTAHILSAKRRDSQVNTSELESKIHQIVYKLYELTEEEIKITEETM